MTSQYSALIMFFVLGKINGGYLQDYCKVMCKEGKHTMCETYYKPGGENCKNFKVFIRPKEVYDILNDVNEWRNTLALGKQYDLPSASNMIQIQWNKEAYTIAKRWAEQCDQVIEDRCRKLLLTSREDGGQCIASATAKGHERAEVLQQIMDYWFSLAMNMTNLPESIDIYRPTADELKYFTQLAWAQTDRMGCGISQTEFNSSFGDDMKYKIVCNFYPRGNIVGRAIYLRGPPCSACPAHYPVCSERYPALCTTRTEAPSSASSLQCFFTAPLNIFLIFVSINQKILLYNSAYYL